MGTLRDEQKQIARNRIMEAVAGEIAEHGLVDLSIPDVATRAGVSQRTVYNYFNSKEGILSAFGGWAVQRLEALGGRQVEKDLPMIADAIEVNFRFFSEMGEISAALARISAAAGFGAPQLEVTDVMQRARTEAVSSAIEREYRDLDPAQAAAVTAIIRQLMSFDTWHRLTAGFGIPGVEAGRTAAWVYRLVLDALDGGSVPFEAGS